MLAALRLTRRPVPSLLIGRRSLSNVAPPPRQPAMMAPGTGSGRGGTPIPGEIPGGPKPVVYRGMVINSKMVWFYSFLFIVPTGLALLFTGGKTQLSREELLNSEAAKAKLRANFGDEAEERQREMKAMMNKVLFENRDNMSDMRPEWAKKRDAKRQREKDAAAAKQREAA